MPSQSNHAAGNTYQDAPAHHRVANRQRATSLDLGWMVSEGIVAKDKTVERRLDSLRCYIPIKTEQFLALMDQCRSAKSPSCKTQIVIGLDIPSRIRKMMNKILHRSSEVGRAVHQIFFVRICKTIRGI